MRKKERLCSEVLRSAQPPEKAAVREFQMSGPRQCHANRVLQAPLYIFCTSRHVFSPNAQAQAGIRRHPPYKTPWSAIAVHRKLDCRENRYFLNFIQNNAFRQCFHKPHNIRFGSGTRVLFIKTYVMVAFVLPTMRARVAEHRVGGGLAQNQAYIFCSGVLQSANISVSFLLRRVLGTDFLKSAKAKVP